MDKDTPKYSINTICGNCGNKQIEEIYKGITVDYALGYRECNVCGCKKLKFVSRNIQINNL